MRHILVLTLLLTGIGIAEAQKRAAPRNKGLCSAEEVVVFSCSIGAKTASLCASADLDATKGTLFYRFGTPQKIEFVYPNGEQDPRTAFGYTQLPRGEAVRFVSGDTQIAIYSESVPRRRDEDGIFIEKAGAKPVDLRCTKGGPGDLGWAPVHKANLPKIDAPLVRR